MIPLHGDDGGEALTRWDQRLVPYLQSQDVPASLRGRPQGERPWPDRDNPMLGYLLDRATEIIDSDGPKAGLTWLAVHAWFEGAIAERAAALKDLRRG